MKATDCAKCRGFDRAPLSRRELLWQAGGGIGGVALAWLLGQEAAAAPLEPHFGVPNPQSAILNPQSEGPYSPHPPHFPPRAKRVIQIFLCGGVSHVDTFDYKPEL